MLPDKPQLPLPQPEEDPVAGSGNMDALRAWLLDARDRLELAGIPNDALAEYVPESRRFWVRRPATMRPLARVWRLGVLLLSTHGELLATGNHTRARERGRQGYQSLSLEERRDTAAAAFRGGFAVGESVNYAAEPINLAELGTLQAGNQDGNIGPILVSGGRTSVRWRAGASAAQSPELQTYLRERLGLLLDPPFAP